MRGTERGPGAPRALEPMVPRGPQTLRGGPDRAQEGHEGSVPETGWAHPRGRAEESLLPAPGPRTQTAALPLGRAAFGPREMDRVFPPAKQIPDTSFFWAGRVHGLYVPCPQKQVLGVLQRVQRGDPTPHKQNTYDIQKITSWKMTLSDEVNSRCQCTIIIFSAKTSFFVTRSLLQQLPGEHPPHPPSGELKVDPNSSKSRGAGTQDRGGLT